MLKRILAPLALATSLLAVGATSAWSQDLRLLTFGGEAQLIAAEDAAAKFMSSHPGVTVTVDLDPGTGGWAGYVTKILSQFNAGRNYDVYHTAIETFHSLAATGVFDPIEDRIKGDDYFDDFDPRLFELSSYKDHTYFVPSTWNNIVTYVNVGMFDEAGIEVPVGGWNWDEFRVASEKLTKRDDNGNITQFGYEVPNFFFAVMPWFYTNGTSLLNEDWTGSNAMDPKVAETFQYLHDIIHVSKASPIPGQDGMDNQFLAGQVAMISRGHWVVQNVRAAEISADIVPVPANVNDHTVIGFGAYGLANNTPDKDLAWDLIKALVSQEAQEAEGDLGGAIPARKSASETKNFLAYPPNAALYYQTLATTEAVPSPANFVDIQQIFDRYYRQMMADEISITDGVKGMHLEFEESFARLVKNQ